MVIMFGWQGLAWWWLLGLAGRLADGVGWLAHGIGWVDYGFGWLAHWVCWLAVKR